VKLFVLSKMIVPIIGGRSYSQSSEKGKKNQNTGFKWPRFTKYSVFALFLLFISYTLSWWGFVILANISGPIKDSITAWRVLKPSWVQLLGLIPAIIIAGLAFGNYLFIVGGVDNN
jgi:hypothetical protein